MKESYFVLLLSKHILFSILTQSKSSNTRIIDNCVLVIKYTIHFLSIDYLIIYHC